MCVYQNLDFVNLLMFGFLFFSALAVVCLLLRKYKLNPPKECFHAQKFIVEILNSITLNVYKISNQTGNIDEHMYNIFLLLTMLWPLNCLYLKVCAYLFSKKRNVNIT